MKSLQGREGESRMDGFTGGWCHVTTFSNFFLGGLNRGVLTSVAIKCRSRFRAIFLPRLVQGTEKKN